MIVIVAALNLFLVVALSDPIAKTDCDRKYSNLILTDSLHFFKCQVLAAATIIAHGEIFSYNIIQ